MGGKNILTEQPGLTRSQNENWRKKRSPPETTSTPLFFLSFFRTENVLEPSNKILEHRS